MSAQSKLIPEAEALPLSPALPSLSGSDLLLWSALPDLTLNIAQTAALCGVSVRQLGYWTNQGYVTATGRGARRLYGPEALRRILAIRHAMQNGLSLRQALRSLADSPLSVSTAAPALGYAPATASHAAPAPADADALAAGLLSLFDRNPSVRDSAAGLATKLGRNPDDIGRVADHLAAQGALVAVLAGGEAVYSRAEGGRA